MDVYESAVEAVIHGDTATLKRLVRERPALVRERSERDHRATLLHYVAANGVEDERQRTPHNAVEIARVLLEAGADANATAEFYGGGPGATPLIALVTSVHPARVGVQNELIRQFCTAGAAVNGINDDGAPLTGALAFGYTTAAETLAECGADIISPVHAAGLGKLDLLEEFWAGNGVLAAHGSPYVDPFGRSITDAQKIVNIAFITACMHRRIAAAGYLIDNGADINARGAQGFTALHYAAWHGHHEMVDYLLRCGASTEVVNDYGGTSLDAAVYAATNMPQTGVDYPAIMKTLIAAGADVAAVDPFPTGNANIDDILRNYGRQ